MENSTIRKRVKILEPSEEFSKHSNGSETKSHLQRDSMVSVQHQRHSRSKNTATQQTPRFPHELQIHRTVSEAYQLNGFKDSQDGEPHMESIDTQFEMGKRKQYIEDHETMMTQPIETEGNEMLTKGFGVTRREISGVPDLLDPYSDIRITFIIPPELMKQKRESVAPDNLPFSMPKPSLMPNRASLFAGRRSQAKKLAQSQHLAKYESLIKSDPDYFNFPADLRLAASRARLNRPHYPNQTFSESNIPLFVPNRSLQRHSLTYFLIFRFMGESVAILFIIFFMSCIYDLTVIAVYSPDRVPIFQNVNLLNALDNLTMIEKEPPHWVNTVKLALNLVSIILIRTYIIAKEIDREGTYSATTQTYTENDFSVLVNYIPRQVTKQQVTAYFNKKCAKIGVGKVHHVIMLLDLTKALKLKEKKKKLLRTYILDTDGSKRIGILEQMQQLDSKILRIRLNQEKNESTYQSAIVVFDRPFVNIDMIRLWRRSGRTHRRVLRCFCSCLRKKKKDSSIRGSSMRVRPCGEPADLNYEHIPITTAARNVRKYSAYLIVGFLILLYPTFQITYQFAYRVTIQNGKLKADTNTSPFIFTVISMGLFLIIKVCLNLLASIQRLIRKSDTEKFKLSALVVLSFFNYNLLLVTKLLTYVDDQLPYVNDLCTLLIGMIITPQIFEIFDPSYLWQRYERWWYQKDKTRLDRLSQAEGDKLMENPVYDFSARVNNAAQILFTCLSTYVFFPIAPLIGITAICFSYYIDRYMILRRAPRLTVKGFDLGLQSFRIFEFDILAQSFGNVVYAVYLSIQGYLDVPSIVMAGIFAFLTLSYILNLNSYLRKRFGSKSIKKKRQQTLQGIKTYEQVKGTFKQTYYEDYKTFLTKNDMLSML